MFPLKTLVIATVGAFALGMLAGPKLQSMAFGYKNAEECAIQAKHRWAVGACYDLYPSVRD